MSLSDLPELHLFEEIQDVSNSSDFFTYTKDQFNKTWSYFQTEAMDDDSTSGLWEERSVSCSSSVLNTPERDTWDPMLDARRNTECEDMNMEDYLGCIALVAPLSPLPIDVVVPLTPVSEDEWIQVSPLRGDEVLDDANSLLPSGLLVDSRLQAPSPSKPSLNVRKTLRPPSPRSLKRKLFAKQSIQARRLNSTSVVSGSQQKLTFPFRKRTISISKKQKLYEMAPIQDSHMEKNRKNAVNSKLNRDLKKLQFVNIQEELSTLRGQNKSLKKKADQGRRQLKAAKQQIKNLKKKMVHSVPVVATPVIM